MSLPRIFPIVVVACLACGAEDLPDDGGSQGGSGSQTAGGSGATPPRVFFGLTLRLAWPGVVAGAVLGFAKALGEFGATITFVSSIPGETQTLASAIYGLLQVPGGEGGVLRLCLFAVALSCVALLASEWLLQRQRAERAT